MNRRGYEIYKLDRNDGAGSALRHRPGSMLHLGFDLEQEVLEGIRDVSSHTMLSYRRLVTLYQQVVYCEKNAIPGALVECGV